MLLSYLPGICFLFTASADLRHTGLYWSGYSKVKNWEDTTDKFYHLVLFEPYGQDTHRHQERMWVSRKPKKHSD